MAGEHSTTKGRALACFLDLYHGSRCIALYHIAPTLLSRAVHWLRYVRCRADSEARNVRDKFLKFYGLSEEEGPLLLQLNLGNLNSPFMVG